MLFVPLTQQDLELFVLDWQCGSKWEALVPGEHLVPERGQTRAPPLIAQGCLQRRATVKSLEAILRTFTGGTCH